MIVPNEPEDVLEEELESVNGGNVALWEVLFEELITDKELLCLRTTKPCDRVKRLKNAMVLAIFE